MDKANINRALYILKEEGILAFISALKRFTKIELVRTYRDCKYKYIKFTKGKKIIINVNNYLMKVNLNDEGISKDLVLDGCREFESTNIVQSLIDKNDVVVDIGANIGYYVILEAILAKKVYAIEPVPSNVELLKENIKLNNLRNVEVYQLAVGDRNYIGKIYLSNKSNWHTMIPKKNTKKYINVPVVTLDEFLSDKEMPDFIRMDVEGFESRIIKGAHKTLENVSKMFIELHFHIMPKNESIELLNTLRDEGFEIYKIFKSFGSNFEYFIWKIIDNKPVEYNYSIDELVRNDDIISGKYGGFEVFFIRR